MDALRAMFPDLDTATLEATLAAHDGSVERAVDFLLSGSSSSPDPARDAQEASDAALARRLQAEEAPMSTFDPSRSSRDPTAPPPSTSNSGLALPSMADVQSAVRPIVNGVMQAGRVAADSVSNLYNEFVGEQHPHSSSASSRPSARHDDSVVLRGEAGSPATSRTAPRQRRPESTGTARGFGDKKDD